MCPLWITVCAPRSVGHRHPSSPKPRFNYPRIWGFLSTTYGCQNPILKHDASGGHHLWYPVGVVEFNNVLNSAARAGRKLKTLQAGNLHWSAYANSVDNLIT
jgi:hypothetical protein